MTATLLPMGFGPACAQRSPCSRHSNLAGSGVLPAAAGTLSPVIRERDQEGAGIGDAPLLRGAADRRVVDTFHNEAVNK